jgi:5-methylcytosine-specific restriction endonuclease McrA
MSEEAKIKIGNSNRGRKISDEQKERLRTLRLGTKITEENKRKISEANRGEKSYLWQGGKSFEQYTTNWSSTLRRSIRERDNYICQMCKSVQADRAFDVHHIDYDKKNCDPRNLITLCQGCHTKTGIKGNRKLFKILLQSSQKLRSFSNNVYVS